MCVPHIISCVWKCQFTVIFKHNPGSIALKTQFDGFEFLRLSWTERKPGAGSLSDGGQAWCSCLSSRWRRRPLQHGAPPPGQQPHPHHCQHHPFQMWLFSDIWFCLPVWECWEPAGGVGRPSSPPFQMPPNCAKWKVSKQHQLKQR